MNGLFILHPSLSAPRTEYIRPYGSRGVKRDSQLLHLLGQLYYYRGLCWTGQVDSQTRHLQLPTQSPPCLILVASFLEAGRKAELSRISSRISHRIPDRQLPTNSLIGFSLLSHFELCRILFHYCLLLFLVFEV